jgi:hypothetical protein
LVLCGSGSIKQPHGGILWLIKQWLKAAIVEEGKDGKLRTTGGGKGNRLATPQGGLC